MNLDEIKIKLLGLHINIATDLAKGLGFDRTRISSQDGEGFLLTSDYREDRLNFDIENSIIKEVWIG